MVVQVKNVEAGLVDFSFEGIYDYNSYIITLSFIAAWSTMTLCSTIIHHYSYTILYYDNIGSATQW